MIRRHGAQRHRGASLLHHRQHERYCPGASCCTTRKCGAGEEHPRPLPPRAGRAMVRNTACASSTRPPAPSARISAPSSCLSVRTPSASIACRARLILGFLGIFRLEHCKHSFRACQADRPQVLTHFGAGRIHTTLLGADARLLTCYITPTPPQAQAYAPAAAYPQSCTNLPGPHAPAPAAARPRPAQPARTA